MSLAQFLSDFAHLNGPAVLEGAVVHVNLKRSTDQAIRWALRLDGRHRHVPHRWSHTFLVAEPWRGRDTRILDMTIRDPEGKVDWHLDLAETVRDFASGAAGKAGGVYLGTVADYDVAGTLDYGVKWLPDLDAEQRRAIVGEGRRLRDEGYHYDFPGLFREAVRFLLHVDIPAGHNLLFCSAFVAECYRAALGTAGDFAASLPVGDVTPDDVWYSAIGANFPALPAGTPVTRAMPSAALRRGVVGSVADLDTVPIGPAFGGLGGGPVAPANVGQGGVSAVAAPTGGLEGLILEELRGSRAMDDDRAAVLDRLLERVRSGGENPLALGSRSPTADDMLLALVWAYGRGERPAVAEPATALDVLHERSAAVRGGGMVGGTDKYEEFDPGWAAALFARLRSERASYPTAPPATVDLGEATSIGILGDWGTGTPVSSLLALRLQARAPRVTIHLGDVYYAGKPEECQRFVDDWPAGPDGSFAINSNHEMYSGGAGFFSTTLGSAKFAAQGGSPNFRLRVKGWRILGLDSAYHALGLLYQTGTLGPKHAPDAPQRAWLRAEARAAAENGESLLLLSHHDGLGEDVQENAFWEDVTGCVADAGVSRVVWYWGHIHAGIVYKPRQVGATRFHLRCCGHGGVPWLPFTADEAARYAWGETERADDPTTPRRARNGFVTLEFDHGRLTETWLDERGVVRQVSVLP